MTRAQKFNIKVSRELAKGTIDDAKILPVPEMRDDLDMEQRQAWHELVGAKYYYLVDDDDLARCHAANGLEKAGEFLRGTWEYRAPDEALWQRYQSSLCWSHFAIIVGYWAPPLKHWTVLSLLFDRLRLSKPDGKMKPEIAHEFVWAMGAYESGQVDLAISRVEEVTKGKGADARLLLAAFRGAATFELLEAFLKNFHQAAEKERSISRKISLIGGYVLHRHLPDAWSKLPSTLQDHVMAL